MALQQPGIRVGTEALQDRLLCSCGQGTAAGFIRARFSGCLWRPISGTARSRQVAQESAKCPAAASWRKPDGMQLAL